MPLITDALDISHIHVSRRWRSCVICGNRTKSRKRVGFSGSPIIGWIPWVVCGDRCSALARLLPDEKLTKRVHAVILRPPLDYISFHTPTRSPHAEV